MLVMICIIARYENLIADTGNALGIYGAMQYCKFKLRIELLLNVRHTHTQSDQIVAHSPHKIWSYI